MPDSKLNPPPEIDCAEPTAGEYTPKSAFTTSLAVIACSSNSQTWPRLLDFGNLSFLRRPSSKTMRRLEPGGSNLTSCWKENHGYGSSEFVLKSPPNPSRQSTLPVPLPSL